MKNRANRAKYYIGLAKQFLESSKLLLNTIIENKNINVGAGFSNEQALQDFYKNLLKSDAMLLTPALFLGYHAVELYIKGLLILKDIEIISEHKTECYLDSLKMIYGENSNIYKAIDDFYNNKVEILKSFEELNEINTTKGIYEALRYPETSVKKISQKEIKKYNHSNLKLNGKSIINQLEEIIQKLDRINNFSQLEFIKEN